MLRPVREFVCPSLCHTQHQKSLMRSWEEVGVVCKEVRWRKGKRKYLCQKYLRQKYFRQKYFRQKYFQKNISAKNIVEKQNFEKNIFVKNIFKNKTDQKYFQKKYLCHIFPNKKVGAQPPLLPAGPRLISSDSEISA